MKDAPAAQSRFVRHAAFALPVLLALLCGASAFYWAALDGYFVNTDASAFVPPMLTYARDGELINTFQPSARSWDSQGIGRQVGHGFLPSIVNGALAPGCTYRSIHHIVAAQIAAGLALFALLLNRFNPPRPGQSARAALFNSLAVLATGQILFRLEGRPEIFAFLITGLALVVMRPLPRVARHLVAGFLLGALAVTSPIAAIFAGLAFVGLLTATEGFLSCLRSLFLAGGATLAGLALWFAFYPYRFIEWIEGNLRHAASAIVEQPAVSIAGWFTGFASGFNGLLFAAAATAAASLLWTHRRSWRQPRLLALICAAFGLTCWYFVFRQGFPIYNLQWLIPFGLIVVFFALRRINGSRLRTLSACVMAALLGNAALMSLRDQVLRHASLADGPPPDEVRRIVGALRESSPKITGRVSGQYFQLFDDPTDLVRVHRESLNLHEFPLPTVVDFVLVNQAEERGKTPAAYLGWKIVRHTFSTRNLHLGGRDLGVPPRGFHYALYLPEAVPVPPALSAVLSQLQASGSESSASNQ